MPLVWRAAEKFLKCKGVSIYHAYKDEFSDIPLDFWYSTCDSAAPGSDYEFDVREIPGYQSRIDGADHTEHKRAIRAAITAGLLRADTPPKINSID
jgi:hypothetical protein